MSSKMCDFGCHVGPSSKHVIKLIRFFFCLLLSYACTGFIWWFDWDILIVSFCSCSCWSIGLCAICIETINVNIKKQVDKSKQKMSIHVVWFLTFYVRVALFLKIGHWAYLNVYFFLGGGCFLRMVYCFKLWSFLSLGVLLRRSRSSLIFFSAPKMIIWIIHLLFVTQI